MSHLNRTLVLAGAIVSLCAGESLLRAQNTPPPGGEKKADAPQKGNRQRGGGNFDPAAMRQRMMDRMKETFEVTNDDEWKIIS
ncbi:MAG: hypothetical protein HY301_19590, partial [Verrucomicrobia bacterium]|nr:hypothetical protein [Verrucomicrobiota bacterium]